MIIRIGGSISSHRIGTRKAQWLDTTSGTDHGDQPKPDQITIAIGTTLMNPMLLTTADDAQGTTLCTAMQAAYQNMVADATPEFYLNILKRRGKGSSSLLSVGSRPPSRRMTSSVKELMGPLNHALVATRLFAGRNPFDFMEYLRRSPQQLDFPPLSRCGAPSPPRSYGYVWECIAVGIEDNLWRKKGERMTSVQQIEQVVRLQG